MGDFTVLSFHYIVILTSEWLIHSSEGNGKIQEQKLTLRGHIMTDFQLLTLEWKDSSGEESKNGSVIFDSILRRAGFKITV